MSRGRSYVHNEWDLLNVDFNNSSYDPQYPDDDAGDRVQIDQHRLYVRNIPKALSEEGLRTAFSKYGTLVRVFLSKDPSKRYALVQYETPGEAKLAMIKLNNTDPLKLNVALAHKSKKKDSNPRDSLDRCYTGQGRRTNQDETSISSRGISFRQHEDVYDGEEVEDSQAIVEDDLDPDTKLKGIQLEIERLKVQEQTVLLKKQLLHLETAKKKLAQGAASNRCILPDGRIVVRNTNDRNLESRDVDGGIAAGAGDSLTLPGLQRESSRECVSCGGLADSYCARCGVTPYCSPMCQRRDWTGRHRAVCHNLARLSGTPTVADQDMPDIQTAMPPAVPLRRPHSPANTRRDQRRDEDQSKDRTNIRKNGPTHNSNNNNQERRNNNNNKGSRNSNNRMGDRWGEKSNPPPTATARKPEQKSKEAPTLEMQPLPKVELEKKPAPQSNGSNGPTSINDVTPTRKVVIKSPKHYLVEQLATDDCVLLSVDTNATDCHTKKAGFVCLSMHERFKVEFDALCEDYVLDCEADKTDFKPSPGDLFSYYNKEDSGWYRARCLTPALAALIDSSKVVPLAAGDRLKRMPAKYEAMPEFCCSLSGNVKVGDNLQCTLTSKMGEDYKVFLVNVETGVAAGEGIVSRWLPEVQYATPAVDKAAGQPQIPVVERPPVTNKSTVLLVDATAMDRVIVRPADSGAQREFDAILQDVVLYGRSATPLGSPPAKGQAVVAQFSDGLHYRALVRRTNVRNNKYQLEYVEFGNVEVTTLEKLYPCPPKLDIATRPAQASIVTLKCKINSAFTPSAAEYLDRIKDNLEPLTLTIISGAESAPSGSEVTLTLVRSNESVNRRLGDMCTPEWKKLEEQGVDVVDMESLMYGDLEYLELAEEGGELEVLDASALPAGVLSVRVPARARLDLQRLTDRMAEYCASELGKEPYLPKSEELCIAKCPPYQQWFRAVLAEHTPGSPTARVCYVDYGNMEDVSVDLLRKMLPEFVRGQPVMAVNLEIKDFPEEPSPAMVARAHAHLRLDAEGRGTVRAAACRRLEPGFYSAHAPDLVRAARGDPPLRG